MFTITFAFLYIAPIINLKIGMKIILLATISVLMYGCFTTTDKKNLEDIKFELLDTDKKFSKLCEDKGIKDAYLEFIDSNGVILKSNSLPLEGGDAIDYILQSNDTSSTMKWAPKSATVAASGDLGYTFGIYQITPKNIDTVFKGTYVSIWKKQPNGKWKFIVNSANDGIE